VAVRGELPSPINPPSGCRFRTRCPLAQDKCAEIVPPLRRFGDEHFAACHFPLQKPLEGESATAEDSRAAKQAGQTITAEDEKIPVEASTVDVDESAPEAV
jgi:hypothetical protein